MVLTETLTFKKSAIVILIMECTTIPVGGAETAAGVRQVPGIMIIGLEHVSPCGAAGIK